MMYFQNAYGVLVLHIFFPSLQIFGSNDLKMKLELVTKLYKKSTATLKETDDDVMSAYCDTGQFGAIRRPDYGPMIC